MERDINEVIAELGESNIVGLYRQLAANNRSNKFLKELQKLFSMHASRGETFYYVSGNGRKVKVKDHCWNSATNLEGLLHRNLFNYIISSYDDVDIKILSSGMSNDWFLEELHS